MKFLIYIVISIFLCSNLALSNESLDELLRNEKLDANDKEIPKVNSQESNDDFIPSSPSDYKKHDNILVHILDKISGKMYKYHGVVGKKLSIKEYDVFVYSCFKRKRIIEEYAYLIGIWKNQDTNKMDLDIDSTGVSKKIFLGWLFSYDKATNYFADEYIDIPLVKCDD